MAGLLLTGAALSSCEDDYFRKEPEFPAGEEYTDEITFGMSLPEDWNPLGRGIADDSASWVNPEPVETGIEIDGKKLYLSLTVSDRRGAGPSREPQHPNNANMSAGREVQRPNGTNMGATPRGSRATVELGMGDELDFGIYAYVRKSMPDGGAQKGNALNFDKFMVNQWVDICKDGNVVFEYTPKKYWTGWDRFNMSHIEFFAYRPFVGTRSDGTEAPAIPGLTIGAFTMLPTIDNLYSLDLPSAPLMTYKVPANAADQTDLLAAHPIYSSVPYKAECFQVSIPNMPGAMFPSDYGKKITFEFKHLLSAVKFRAGNITDGVINKVGLQNVHGEGECLMSESSMRYTDEANKSFSQELDITVGTVEDSPIGETFFMIPQAFANDNPSLLIDLSFAGEQPHHQPKHYEILKPLRDFSAEWLAGKTYTYKLSVPQEVDVVVTDKTNGNVKSNVEIKNNGMTTTFIRAAIVGSWVTVNDNNADQYDIVGSWRVTDTAVGSIDWGDADASFGTATQGRWFKGADGFYYYIAKVAPGATIPTPLFKSYTLTANAPLADAHLELVVAAQAVVADQINSVTGWDANAVAALKALQ